MFDSYKPTITRSVLLRFNVLRTMDFLQRVSDPCFRVDLMFLVHVGRISTFKGAFFVSRATMEPGTPDRYSHWRECLVFPWVSHPRTRD